MGVHQRTPGSLPVNTHLGILSERNQSRAEHLQGSGIPARRVDGSYSPSAAALA